MEEHMKQKKPLVRYLFTADPSAHVFDDRNYIYVSDFLCPDIWQSVYSPIFVMIPSALTPGCVRYSLQI